MSADDVCLAVYGLKSFTHYHQDLIEIVKYLRWKTHYTFDKPSQPWEDYERMLPASHAGMFYDVLHGNSNPAFNTHSIATALEGLRALNQNLCCEVHSDSGHQYLLGRIQNLQATLLTKLQYTDAPLNLTHLSMILNSLR